MITLDIDSIDSFIDTLHDVNVRWNGWVLQFLRPDPRAEFSPNGARQNGQWGYITTVEPDSRGLWTFKEQYAVTG